MSIIDLHHRALEVTNKVVANVKPEQLSAKTPCAAFTVKDLLNHMIGGNHMFVAAAKGEEVKAPDSPPDFVGNDPHSAWKESSAAVQQAWSDESLLAKTAKLPFAELPGEVALGIHFMEALVHGWDLAKATGQDTTLPDDLAEQARERITPLASGFPRGVEGAPFGHEVQCAEGATATERLVSFLGRNP